MNILKFLNNNPFFNAIRNISSILEADQKKKAIWMMALLLINAVFDVLGLSLIAPIIKIASEPDIIESNEYINYAYNLIGLTDPLHFLLILSILLLIGLIGKNVLGLIILYIQAKFAFEISFRMNEKQFRHFYQQGFLFLKEKDAGDKTYDIITIPYTFSSVYIMQTLIFATELVVVSIILLGMLLYNPLLILVISLVIFPAFILIYATTKSRVKAIGDRRNVILPKNLAKVLESMEAYVNVKLANREQLFLDDYKKIQAELNLLDAKQAGIYQKIPQKSNEIIVGLGIVMIFVFAIIFPKDQSSILTVLTLFGLAAFRLMPSINRMMNSILEIKNTSYTIEKLAHLKDLDQPPFKTVPTMPFKSTLAFENISFHYPDSEEWVLENFSLELKKGEVIGVIGESGSGKSTLLNLFLRLLIEQKGQFKVDGIAVKEENRASFQKNIGYVEQEVFIKNESLLENIAFGVARDKIDMKKVEKVLAEAQLTQFVHQLKDGLHTVLGERGNQLSGGQKQRIGIARALYKDAEIFVLDEITSALDRKTEKEITEMIHILAQLNKTILIVAHRISTLSSCNRIYEIKNGAIEKTFSYHELVAANPI